MAFHVACPITCRRVCWCKHGTPASMRAVEGQRVLMQQAVRLYELVQDPRKCFEGEVADVLVEAPPVKKPQKVVSEPNKLDAMNALQVATREHADVLARIKTLKLKLQEHKPVQSPPPLTPEAKADLVEQRRAKKKEQVSLRSKLKRLRRSTAQAAMDAGLLDKSADMEAEWSVERLQEMLELSQAKKQRAADALQAVRDTTLDHPAILELMPECAAEAQQALSQMEREMQSLEEDKAKEERERELQEQRQRQQQEELDKAHAAEQQRQQQMQLELQQKEQARLMKLAQEEQERQFQLQQQQQLQREREQRQFQLQQQQLQREREQRQFQLQQQQEQERLSRLKQQREQERQFMIRQQQEQARQSELRRQQQEEEERQKKLIEQQRERQSKLRGQERERYLQQLREYNNQQEISQHLHRQQLHQDRNRTQQVPSHHQPAQYFSLTPGVGSTQVNISHLISTDLNRGDGEPEQTQSAIMQQLPYQGLIHSGSHSQGPGTQLAHANSRFQGNIAAGEGGYASLNFSTMVANSDLRDSPDPHLLDLNQQNDTEAGGLIPTSAIGSSSTPQPVNSTEDPAPTPTPAAPVVKEVQGQMDAEAKEQITSVFRRKRRDNEGERAQHLESQHQPTHDKQAPARHAPKTHQEPSRTQALQNTMISTNQQSTVETASGRRKQAAPMSSPTPESTISPKRRKQPKKAEKAPVKSTSLSANKARQPHAKTVDLNQIHAHAPASASRPARGESAPTAAEAPPEQKLVTKKYLRDAAKDPEKSQLYITPLRVFWVEDEKDGEGDWWPAQFVHVSLAPGQKSRLLYEEGDVEDIDAAGLMELVAKGHLAFGPEDQALYADPVVHEVLPRPLDPAARVPPSSVSMGKASKSKRGAKAARAGIKPPLVAGKSLGSGAKLLAGKSHGSGAKLLARKSLGSGAKLFAQKSHGSGAKLLAGKSLGSGAKLLARKSLGSGAKHLADKSLGSGAKLLAGKALAGTSSSAGGGKRERVANLNSMRETSKADGGAGAMPEKRSPQQKRLFPNEAGKGYVKPAPRVAPTPAAADNVVIDVSRLLRVRPHELHDTAHVKGRSVVFERLSDKSTHRGKVLCVTPEGRVTVHFENGRSHPIDVTKSALFWDSEESGRVGASNTKKRNLDEATEKVAGNAYMIAKKPRSHSQHARTGHAKAKFQMQNESP